MSTPTTSGSRPSFTPRTQGTSTTPYRPSTGTSTHRPTTGSLPPRRLDSKPGEHSQQRSGGKDFRYFVNDQIKAFKVLLLDEEGKQVGTFSREKALEMAYSQGLDLIQVSYNPVESLCTAKIMDFGKFMYDKKKNEKDKKKNQKSKPMKEVKMSYGIADNDFNLKIQQADKFLKDGHPVLFIVKLIGRENAFKEKMLEKLKIVETTLQASSKTQGIKNEPKGYSMILFPKSK